MLRVNGALVTIIDIHTSRVRTFCESSESKKESVAILNFFSCLSVWAAMLNSRLAEAGSRLSFEVADREKLNVNNAKYVTNYNFTKYSRMS